MLNKSLSRRDALKSGGAFVTAALISPLVVSSPAMAQNEPKFSRPLAIPMENKGILKDGVRHYDLNIQAGMASFFAGLKTPSLGINGDFLGPVLRMRKGQIVRLNVVNGLKEKTTLHWHGFNLPAMADGGPHQIIDPGKSWSPEFMIREEASTMWYHSHLMDHTAAQVWAGLAGMIIINSDAADRLDLPSDYGVDDIPVVLQDRRFRQDGTMTYSASRHDQMAGMIGNFPIVNGTIQPHLNTTTAKVRLRLLNGSNGSIYNLEFSDGRSFQQIASDGGLLVAPVTSTELRLAPGERAEIVVDVSSGENVHLRSVANRGNMMGRGMMAGAQTPEFSMLELRPLKTLPKPRPLPDKLAALAQLSPSGATNTRYFRLEMPGMGMGMARNLTGGGYTINGESMDMGRIDNVVKKGEVEIWQIENDGPMAHPFHVHNTQFRILDRDGQPPKAGEAGRKDTVLVNSGEVVRILVRFDHYTDPDRPYMYHCHILEHEDAGMMGQFTVV